MWFKTLLLCVLASYWSIPQCRSDKGPTRNLTYIDNSVCECIPGIDSTVLQLMKKYDIQGASLAVMRNDSLLYVRGYGWADTEAGEAMQPYHRMRIASCSKLMTAIGIMKMVDNGWLKLDDKVFAPGGQLRWLVPEGHDERLEEVTVYHILRHQGGFANLHGRRDPMFETGTGSPVEICRKVLARPLKFTPGEATDYSNTGYFLLGKLIESVSGCIYEEWMQENIFKPSDCYGFAIGGCYMADLKANEVKYYLPPGTNPCFDFHGTGEKCAVCYGGNNVTGLEGAGGWIASPAELARVVAGIDNCKGIGNILSQSSIQQMAEACGKDEYALGWSQANPNGVLTRTGSFGGTTSIIRYYTRDGDCWIFTTNSSTCLGARIGRQTAKMIAGLRHRYLKCLGHKDLFRE